MARLEEFLITWVVCFAVIAILIYLRDSVKPPNKKKIGVWSANIPSLVLAILIFAFRYILP
jgi:glucan phosphoethanolaminetransferase (alkaline phosphatase superfamily)